MAGFEPATSSSRTKRATGLRYIPTGNQNLSMRIICQEKAMPRHSYTVERKECEFSLTNITSRIEFIVNNLGFMYI